MYKHTIRLISLVLALILNMLLIIFLVALLDDPFWGSLVFLILGLGGVSYLGTKIRSTIADMRDS